MVAIEDLVSSMYEAAAVSEKWPELLDRFGALIDARGAAFFTTDSFGISRHLTTPSYEAAFSDYLKNGTRYENVRPKRALANHLMGFATDLDVCTQEELDRDPLYQLFLKPHGFGWTAGTAMPVPSGDVLVFDLAGSLGRGPFDRGDMQKLDAYRPHLARAALLAHRLGLKAARDQAQALEAVGLPAAVLASQGRVLAANELFLGLSPTLKIGPFNRTMVQDNKANSLLLEALAAEVPFAGQALSIPVKATEEQPALVLHVLPVRRAAGDIFTRATHILIGTPVTMPKEPLRKLLMGLFDLTPAEAGVAAMLGQGKTLKHMSQVTGAALETIRSHLKSVMRKTGTERQAELALLLTGTRSVSPSSG